MAGRDELGEREPLVSPEVIAREPRAGRLSAPANGLALAVVAAGSGTQVALYLNRFGTNHGTDGFIAAFAVYSFVVVVAQILRTTAVPLVSGQPPRLSHPRFGWAVLAIAVVTAAVFAGLSEPLARLLTSASGAHARSIASGSLLVMAPAMGLQIGAAGLAVGGGLRHRLVGVAAAYTVSAVVGLISYFVLVDPAGERVLAYTVLASSATAVLLMLPIVRAHPSRPPPLGALLAAMALVMRTTPIPASFVVMYPITLALIPGVVAGTITIFGLAFTACAYLSGATGQALSMVRVFAHSEITEGKGGELVSSAFRYSMLIAVPGLGVGIVAGQPIVHALLASRAGHAKGFAVDLLLLTPWLVATLALWAALPGVLAHSAAHRVRQTTVAVLGLLAVHVACSLLGRAIWGFHGLIVASAAAPAAFTVAAVWVLYRRSWHDLVRDATLILGAAAAAFGAAVPIRILIGGGAGAGVAAAALGAALYACLIGLAYPRIRNGVVGWRG